MNVVKVSIFDESERYFNIKARHIQTKLDGKYLLCLNYVKDSLVSRNYLGSYSNDNLLVCMLDIKYYRVL